MKLFILSDLQLDSNPPRDRKNQSGRSIRFEENLETIRGVLVKAMDAGAQGWVFPGDLTEHKNPNSVVMEAAASLFRYVLDRGGFVYGVAGNHDGGEFSVSSSSLAPLALMGGEQFKLFHKVEYDPKLRMLAVPYIHRASPQEIAAMIDAAYAANPPVGDAPVFATIHYGVTGAVLGAANTVLHGDYLDAETLLRRPLDHIICGHIHKAQQIELGSALATFPGSPVICNMGERTDRKTWCLFDTDTREITVNEIPQRRRWVSIPWQQFTPTDPQWSAGDLVAITGEHPRGTVPKLVVSEHVKAGAIPEPFHITFESKPQRAPREERQAVSADEGLREGLRKFSKERKPRSSEEPGQVAPALALAMDTVSEQGGGNLYTEIVPVAIRIRDFTTIASIDYEFTDDNPVLVLGENGIGKSNFQAAMYWAQTGDLPKGLGLTEAVNRSKDACSVEVEYIGRSPEQTEQRFRIRRSVKISKDGAAKGALTLSKLDAVTGEWDDKTLNDGGERDRQARLNQIFGGSAMVQRITNFSIQRDRESFIDVHPKIRKTVIGEITGQDPLKKAHAKLDEGRRAAARALEDARQRFSGMMSAAGNTDEALESAARAVSDAESALKEATAALEDSARIVSAAAASVDEASKAHADAEAALAGIPATEAHVASAKAAKEGYESSYASKQAERRAEYNKASENAKDAEAKVAELAVPDPAEVDRLAGLARAAEAEVEAKRAARDGAVSAAAQAAAQADGASGALKSARDRLEGIPSPGQAPDIAALEGVLGAANEARKEAAAKAERANQALSLAREKAAGFRATLDGMRRDRAALEAQDIGKCSRCGQPVDSAHAEAEIKRLDAEIAAGQKALDSLDVPAVTAAWQAAGEAFSTADAAYQKAEQDVAKARDAHANAERLESQRKAASEEVKKAEADAASSSSEAARAQAEAVAAKSELDEAVAAHANAAAAHRAAADAAATAAALQERLRAARTKMQDLIAAGTADKEAHEQRLAELSDRLRAAEAAHALAEDSRKVASEKVASARAVLEGRRAALTEAQVREADARGKVSLAQAKLEEAKRSHESVKSLAAQIQGARIEVQMHIEQAQITSIAVDLVEEFRLALVDNAIPFLEDRANYWLEKLGSEDLAVRFTTRDGDKDTLDVLVDDGKPGRPLDIACYSGGQCARLEMAIKRALNELRKQSVGVSLMLHMYDEPTDGLDGKGKQAFVEMVTADHGVRVITSHDDAIIHAFDHQIRLVRDDNDNTVVE